MIRSRFFIRQINGTRLPSKMQYRGRSVENYPMGYNEIKIMNNDLQQVQPNKDIPGPKPLCLVGNLFRRMLFTGQSKECKEISNSEESDSEESDSDENSHRLSQLTKKLKLQEENLLYIVVDSDMFLDNLEIIKEVTNIIFKNYPHYIFIPWTVIRELDNLVNDEHYKYIQKRQQEAIAFLLKQFPKHPCFIVQTRDEAMKNIKDLFIDCPHDEIVQCCLQIRKLRKSVVLLSYNEMLCLKAVIHNVHTLGYDDVLKEIEERLR